MDSFILVPWYGLIYPQLNSFQYMYSQMGINICFFLVQIQVISELLLTYHNKYWRKSMCTIQNSLNSLSGSILSRDFVYHSYGQLMKIYLLFHEFFFGCLDVSHTQVLEASQFHGVWSVVELFYVYEPQLSEIKQNRNQQPYISQNLTKLS